MINWLIIMSTEWLMQICYFRSFSNTNIGNSYDIFRLDIFLFLSCDNYLQFFGTISTANKFQPL